MKFIFSFKKKLLPWFTPPIAFYQKWWAVKKWCLLLSVFCPPPFHPNRGRDWRQMASPLVPLPSPPPPPLPEFPSLKTRLRVIKRVFISADRKTSSNSSSTDLVFRPRRIHSIAGLRTRRTRARISQARTVSQRGTCSFRRASPVISGFVRRRVDGYVEMRNWGYRCCRACVFLLYFFVIASKIPRFSRPAWSSSEFR